MARNSEEADECTLKPANGHTCHVENGNLTHSSKRKRTQKPKYSKTPAKIIVQDILLASEDTPQKEKAKPCRRSERKIIPSSLWDNAVINPFFERKRRKLSDSPNKTSSVWSSTNGSKACIIEESISTSPANGFDDGKKDITSPIIEEVIQDNINSEPQGHVRLRRSSRKHSSSVSSISDSKYTIKSDPNKVITSDTDEKTVENETDHSHELSESITNGDSHSISSNDEPGSNIKETDSASQDAEDTFKSIDDEIEVKTQFAFSNQAESENMVDTSISYENGDASESSNHAEMIIEMDEKQEDSAVFKHHRGKKRGRSRKLKKETDGVKSKAEPTDMELTVSKEEMKSKEAQQLIDGSSFQRFYRMRTRRQNSSNEEVTGKCPTPMSTRRFSSRSNSGASKDENSAEIKKHKPKQVKPDILCSFCLQTEGEREESMISCCLCGASGHPSCLQFDTALTERVKLYDWECIECKKCELCRNSGDDATLLFCDDCDKGFHMSCLDPPLPGEPDGHWSCLHCVEGSTYWADKIRKTGNSTKMLKRKSDKASRRKQLLDDLAMFHEAQSRAQAAMTEEAKLSPKVKSGKKKGPNGPPTIKSVELGCYEITAWYSSPYPAEYALQNKLYICEFCLKYMKSGVIASRHIAKCPARCPPGDEIYRKETISVFEVDGRKNKTYCQNLCLLAKLFLDHKTLYYDVEPFLFYILTEYDRKGCHIVGYFSKEKNSFLSYNVSCILVIPPYMKKGYGKMLIDFSYALSRKEGKLGSPEKPLSDLGLVSYRNYWKEKLLEYFIDYNETEITIKSISQALGFNPYDIVSTLQAYGMIKYHKSNHYVLKRPEMLAAYKKKLASHSGQPSRSIDMSKLKWIPRSQRDNNQ